MNRNRRKCAAACLAGIFLLYALVPSPMYAASSKIETELIALLERVITLLLEEVRLLKEQVRMELEKQAHASVEAKAIVYLLCRYTPQAGEGTDGDETLVRGSGIIVSPEGHILTARHIVDPAWAALSYPKDQNAALYKELASSYALSGCDVSLPSANTLPTAGEIKTINPSLRATAPLWSAELEFVPAHAGVSQDEYTALDFGILKITRPASCEAGSACSLPPVFPYVLASRANVEKGGELIGFGYPVEGLGGFGEANLKGVVGTMAQYFSGDLFFKDKPLTFEWKANDARHGRSGSPIFSRNLLIGIELGAEPDNVTVNYGLGIPAVYEIANGAGHADFLTIK